jgi:hypothetical protein
MTHKQATPDGIRKPSKTDRVCTVEMGASLRPIEVWHNKRSENKVTAIWRNEVGPAYSTLSAVAL